MMGNAAKGIVAVTNASGGNALSIPVDIPVLRTEHGVILVPVHIRHRGHSNTLSMGLDYDELLLHFVGWSRHGSSIATRVDHESVDFDRGIATATFKLDPGASPVSETDDDGPILAWALFQLHQFAFEGEKNGYSHNSPLRFVENLTRFALPGGAADRLSEGFTPSLQDGSLTIYMQDLIEFGSARMTPHFQSFSIPVFVTHVEEDFGLLAMGLDYDELFLTLIDVRPATGDGPESRLRSRDIDWWGKSDTGPGGAEVYFSGGPYPQLLRHHLLDLHFELNPGTAMPDMLRVCPTTWDDSALFGPDEGGGQGRPELRSGAIGIVSSPFIRGDVTVSGSIDVADALSILEAVYVGGSAFPCADAADANASGQIGIDDSVFLLNFLFRGGANPPAPFPEVGFTSESADAAEPAGSLGCHAYGTPYFELLPMYDE